MANIALVDTVADLRNINGSMIEACCQVRAVRLSGYYTATDGAGGPILIWDATSTAADDGLSVFQPTGVTTGRWIRQLQDEPSVNVLWGGAVGDDVADDSVAVQNAYNYVNSIGRGTVLFPAGKTFKLVSFVEMFSNTTTWILGTVDCYNKAGGLFSYEQQNVHIYGFGSGLLTDSTITAETFIFNQTNTGPNFTVSPCVHLRSCTQCSVNDINIIYCTIGVWSSNCTANSFPNPNALLFSGSGCTQVAYRNINLAYSEGDGLLAHNSVQLCWTGGKVYRSADGGIVMFSCGNSFIGGGMIRESPYGNGSLTPINDVEGLALERCTQITISDMQFFGIAFDPIGIKNGCTRIVVNNVEISDCQATGIMLYNGDHVFAPNGQITLKNIRIKNLGYQHYDPTVVTFRRGGIYADSTYCLDIEGITFEGYQTYSCMNLTGPGAYLINFAQASPYPIPRQSYVTIKNVTVSMWNDVNFLAYPGDNCYQLTSATPVPILITGLHDSITLDGITIKGDWFYSNDSRAIPSFYAINISGDTTTVITPGTNPPAYIWPISIDVKNVNINNWNMGGVYVESTVNTAQMSVQLSNIKTAFISGDGIRVSDAFAVNCSGCYVAGPGNSTTAGYGFYFSSCIRVLFNSNSAEGSVLGGSNCMSYGAYFTSCNYVNMGTNEINAGVTGTIGTVSCTNVLTGVNQ